jgi:hypothetical protein
MIRATVYGVPLVAKGAEMRGEATERKREKVETRSARIFQGNAMMVAADAERSRRTRDVKQGAKRADRGAFHLPSLSFQGGAK